MSFTFDLLKQNEILAMQDRQQQPIVKLTSLEQFYTDVSMVYEKQKQLQEEEKEEEDEDDQEEEEENEKEEEMFATIIDNLDKARYQLDEMCNVIDMLSNSNNNNNELLYKLSRPLTYEIMKRPHFCAISQQKRDQFIKSINIFQNGMVSINKSIEKGRRFSKNLIYLSKYWRLTTLNILKNDNYLNIPNGSNNNVFIDYRLQRKENNLNGLLPLLKTNKTGNIQIYVSNNNNNNDDDDNNKWEAQEEKTEKKQENIIGFDDDDDDSEDEEEDEEEEEDSWHRICEYVYDSQINLLYFELFNFLRMEICDWNPKYYHGIICKLQSNGICIHTPSAKDFVIKFIISNDNNNNNGLKQDKKWNKFIICGDEENIDKKICSDIEQNMIKMLIKKIQCNNCKNDKNKFTLNELKNDELKYLKHLNGGNIFNLNNLIGKFEGNNDDNKENVNDNDNNDNYDKILTISENKCELLEYIITKINHHRLSKKLKKLLLEFSQKNKIFNIKWNQLNSKNIVNVIIKKREKVLLSITLNGLKITVIKYFNHLKKTNYLKQAQVSKVIPVFNVQQLQKILSSFSL